MPDINFWLAQKYALLQQQADATTKNAATNALTGGAAANLDQTRANLLPAESASAIAKMGAETGLIGQQARVIGPESFARISQMGAETGFTNTNAAVARREGLTERSILPSSLQSIMGLRGYTGFRLSE